MKIMGGVGGPITENLGMRLLASINEADGPFQNKYTGEDVHRGSVKRFAGELAGRENEPQQTLSLVPVTMRVALLHSMRRLLAPTPGAYGSLVLTPMQCTKYRLSTTCRVITSSESAMCR